MTLLVFMTPAAVGLYLAGAVTGSIYRLFGGSDFSPIPQGKLRIRGSDTEPRPVDRGNKGGI